VYKIKTVKVLDSTMEVFVFRPQGEGPHPGLLLAQHIPMGHTGLENDVFTLTTAQRFADSGFIVAVPFIFHWWPKDAPLEQKREESRDDWMVADMQAAFALLKNESGIDSKRIGVVGHCWGGRVAWLTACHIHELAAMATFYGGNVKNCPVIGFFGNDDSNPSRQDVEDYSAALSAAGVAHEFHQYDGAGHAFQNFPMPERFNAAASADAWDKVLEFLGDKLGAAVTH